MNRLLDKVWTLGKGRVEIGGHFYPAGTGAPTTDAGTTLGWSVARTGVGIYVVTFADLFVAYIRKNAHLSLNAPDGSKATIQSLVLSTGKLTIKLLDSTNTLFDPAANANNCVDFSVLFKNSSVANG